MFILLVLGGLMGCVDYHLQEGTDPLVDTGLDETEPVVSTDTNCEFITNEGETSAMPIFSLIGSDDFELQAGKSLVLEVDVVSSDSCGDIKLSLLGFTVLDPRPGSREWMNRISQRGIPAELVDAYDYSAFPPTVANGVATTADGNTLRYVWHDGQADWSPAQPADNMSPELIEADSGKTYGFVWPATAYTPAKTILEVSLSEVCWEDIATGVSVCTDQGLDVTATVRIIR
ncbi:MAG: hypothetical protein WAZ14_04520 [Patescibacteria group bacterium]